jgi:purine-binding chemotaxis protein CheW
MTMTTPAAAPAAWDLRDALWALQASAPPARDRCLLCTVGRTRLALPMAQLRGVEPYEAVTPVPHVPAWVLGVTNVRGTVVGVVDLAGFLGLGEVPLAGGRLLVCGAGTRLVAFAVGAARDVLDYAPDTLIPVAASAPAPAGGRGERFVTALVPTEESAVPLLDLERLLGDDELVTG